MAFEDNKDGSDMSAFLEGAGNTVADVMQGHEQFALAAVTVGLVQGKGLRIVPMPLPGLPSHVEVAGRKSGSVKSALAKAARWVIEPPDRV